MAPGVLGHNLLLLPLSSLPLSGPLERNLVTVGLLTLASVASEPGGDEVVSVGLIFPKLDATCLSLIKQHPSHYV